MPTDLQPIPDTTPIYMVGAAVRALADNGFACTPSRFVRAARDAELLGEITPSRTANGSRLFSRADLQKVQHRIELRTGNSSGIHAVRAQTTAAA